MKIINKLKSIISFRKNQKEIDVVDVPEISMDEREEKIFEKEQLSLQKLYEQWTCKESWLLYKEGMPLLFGLNPKDNHRADDDVAEKIESLWEHAQECVNKKLLSVVNADLPVKEWEVRPIDLYSWATISRINMPDEFSMLMTFVAQTIKPMQTQQNVTQPGEVQDILYQKHREVVLGAAMSLLVNANDLCMNNKGKVDSNKIAKNIMENEKQWFGEERPMLTQSTMTDLINEYLKLARPIV